MAGLANGHLIGMVPVKLQTGNEFMEASNKLTTIDLFAGAGGLSEGFHNAGFQTLFANDQEKAAVKTFLRNHPETKASSEPIESLDPLELMEELGLKPGELDALIGGPPCQGFSTYGKRDEADTRNQLYMHFLRFLDAFQPKAFVIENVTGILSMSGGAVVEDITERLRGLGYGVSVWKLDAREYGVPQRRKRVFITGLADGGQLCFPVATNSLTKEDPATADLFGKKLPMPFTIRDAISDLPVATRKPRETHEAMAYQSHPKTAYQKLMREGSKDLSNHSSKQMLGIRRLRLALLHPGDWGKNIEARLSENGLPEDVIDRMLGGEEGLRDVNQCRKQDREKELALREMLTAGNTSIDQIMAFMDSQGFANKYRRLHWDEPSHTLVAHMARDCSDFVHPKIDRFISVREAARLQSFPDRFYFEGSQFMQLKQIGNAVPPRLGEAVARAVSASIRQHCPRQSPQIRHDPQKMAALG